MDNRRRTLNDNISTIFLLNVGTVPTVWYIFFSFYYSFIPMSGCVGMGPNALLFSGVRDAVKTALLLLLLSKKQHRGSTHVNIQ
jgi:hypothetical protein